MLQQIEELKDDVNSLEAAVSEPEVDPNTIVQQNMINLSEEEKKILSAMKNSKFPLRVTGGIAKDTGYNEDEVNLKLHELLDKGFVEKRPSKKKTNSFVWKLTGKGVQII